MVMYFITGAPGNTKRNLAQTLKSGARAFLDAANALNKKTAWVKYFLLFHAIELGLKSALAGKGFKESQLMALRHNLARTVKCVERERIELSAAERRAFLNFKVAGRTSNPGSKNASVVFRYDHYSFVKCPDLDVLTAAVTSFISRLN
jgi:hypothetical protein